MSSLLWGLGRTLDLCELARHPEGFLHLCGAWMENETDMEVWGGGSQWWDGLSGAYG